MKRVLAGLCCLAVGLGVAMAPAHAADIEANLVYDGGAPGRVKFIDREYSSYCTLQGCADNVYAQPMARYQRLFALGGPAEDRMSLGMPGERVVTLSNNNGHLPVTVRFIGVKFLLVPKGGAGFDPSPLSGTVSDQCRTTYSYQGGNYLATIWMRSSAAAPSNCSVDTSDQPPRIWLSDVVMEPAFSVSLRDRVLPPAGVYEALEYFTVAHSDADFVLGRNTSMQILNQWIHFTLRVNPELSVRFPEPADTLPLKPSHGGDARPGDSLHARFPFQLSTNGPFRVSYLCGTLASDGRCAMNTPSTNVLAPFDVGLQWDTTPTLAPGYPPDGVNHGRGRTYGYAPAAGGSYNGTVNFDMRNTTPLYAAPWRQWEGEVTLIFDAGL